MNIGSQKMQNAAPSDCQSFCSSQNLNGQFRKVSIGITVDKCLKAVPIMRNENAASLAAGGRTFSCQDADESVRAGIVGNFERNRLEAGDNHKVSAVFSTRPERFTRVETPTDDTVKFVVNGVPILLSEDGVHKKSNIAYGSRKEKGGNEQRVEEVAFATMQETLLVDNGNASEEPEKLAKFTYGTRRGEGEDIERTQKVALPKKQLVGEKNRKDDDNKGKPLSHNGKEPEKMAKCKSETLKTKLWEILGTAPLENKHTINSENFQEHKESLNRKGAKLNSPDLEGNKENLNINQSKVFLKRNMARPKQNSDPIETDSESSSPVMRKPVTRSSTRKKASTKRVQMLQSNGSCGKKPLSSSDSDFKLKLEKKNIFAFGEEGKVATSGRSSSGHSTRSKGKVEGQNKAEIDPQGIYFPRSIPKKSSQNEDKERSVLTPDRTFSQCKEKENSFVPHQDKEQFLQAPDGTPNDGCHSQKAEQHSFGSPLWEFNRGIRENTESPLLIMKRSSWGHEKSSSESKSAFQIDDIAFRSMGKESDLLDDFHSPTFAAGVFPTSPCIPQKEVLSSSPANQPSKSMKKSYNSKDLDNSTPESSDPDADADTESSDDNKEIHEQVDMESPHMKIEEPRKRQFSLSPMEEQDTEGEAEDLTNQDFELTDRWFPRTFSPRKSPLSYHPTKRARSLNNVKLSSANLFSPAPIGASGTEEIFGSLESLEQYPEGSLARCVAQLALALNKFKGRMKSQTSKRSSEIMSALADKIHQQFLDVESVILTDFEKFNNIGKSKRMHFKSRFQEEQEKLKLIHDKFKEEINQHLMDCRTILEELEGHNAALKGTADRQKASHRKLVLKTEEAMVVQIDDAKTKIAAIHKNAGQKMTILKHALKEWLD